VPWARREVSWLSDPRGCGSLNLTPSPRVGARLIGSLGLGSRCVRGKEEPQGRDKLPRSGVPSLPSELELGGTGLEHLEGEPEGPRDQPTNERIVQRGKGAEQEVAFGHNPTIEALLNGLRRVIVPHVVLQEVAVARIFRQSAGKALLGDRFEEGFGRVPVPKGRRGLLACHHSRMSGGGTWRLLGAPEGRPTHALMPGRLGSH